MKQHERALQELKNWCEKNGGGLQVLYAGHSPTVVDNIPHPWQCTASNNRQTAELYHAYGVTFEEAVIRCYERFQNQDFGYEWERVTHRDTWFMTPDHWRQFRNREGQYSGIKK